MIIFKYYKLTKKLIHLKINFQGIMCLMYIAVIAKNGFTMMMKLFPQLLKVLFLQMDAKRMVIYFFICIGNYLIFFININII